MKPWLRGILATALTLTILGAQEASAWAATDPADQIVVPQGIVLLSVSTKLTLDGKEYVVSGGKLVSATSLPPGTLTVQAIGSESSQAVGEDFAQPPEGGSSAGDGFVQLPADPLDDIDDGTIVLPGFQSESGVRAPSFSSFPPSGFHTFTHTNPYWGFSDLNGAGAEQEKYGNNRTIWGYQMSPAIRQIVVGLVSQTADRYHGHTIKHYASHLVGAAYFHHGSSGGIESVGTYATTFRATFHHNIGPGGNAVLSVQWNWKRR